MAYIETEVVAIRNIVLRIEETVDRLALIVLKIAKDLDTIKREKQP